MPETVGQIIDDVIRKETSGKPNGAPTNDPKDGGGRTQYGISEKANPEAWADGKVTEEEARAIFFYKYVKYPGFDRISDSKLMAQMVDFGVNSGQATAIMKLQKALNVPQDGVLGPGTLAILATANPQVVNNLVVASRVRLLGRIVQNNPTQLIYLSGWLDRALQFLV
jgi:lysozyme family protein